MGVSKVEMGSHLIWPICPAGFDEKSSSSHSVVDVLLLRDQRLTVISRVKRVGHRLKLALVGRGPAGLRPPAFSVFGLTIRLVFEVVLDGIFGRSLIVPFAFGACKDASLFIARL